MCIAVSWCLNLRHALIRHQNHCWFVKLFSSCQLFFQFRMRFLIRFWKNTSDLFLEYKKISQHTFTQFPNFTLFPKEQRYIPISTLNFPIPFENISQGGSNTCFTKVSWVGEADESNFILLWPQFTFSLFFEKYGISTYRALQQLTYSTLLFYLATLVAWSAYVYSLGLVCVQDYHLQVFKIIFQTLFSLLFLLLFRKKLLQR